MELNKFFVIFYYSKLELIILKVKIVKIKSVLKILSAINVEHQ